MLGRPDQPTRSTPKRKASSGANVDLPVLSKPEVIAAAARDYGATLFFAGPTLLAGMLRAGLRPDSLAGVRLAASAAEALPAALVSRDQPAETVPGS